VADFLTMDAETFRQTFGKTALARAGLAKIQSNIRAMDRHR
jgi:epoxyqueuosine reductase QueG